ncbi:hypothetical protein M5689_021907 [Euphorbia peplus]|nr:hypothetical protein M5689_021907 [Euphorbia peplus]
MPMEDDARLYICFNKYEEIVKQVLKFDELTDTMDHRTKRSNKGRNIVNKKGVKIAVMESESFDQVIVETISKFVDDLNASTTVDPHAKSSDDDD